MHIRFTLQYNIDQKDVLKILKRLLISGNKFDYKLLTVFVWSYHLRSVITVTCSEEPNLLTNQVFADH